MSTSKNLFLNNKFKFTLTGERFNDNEFDVVITGLNIPGLQLGVIGQPSTIRNIERPGDSIIFNDLSIEFLITENFEEWIIMYNWFNDLRDFSKMTFDNSIVADGMLILLTNKNNPNIGLKFINMFPYNLSDIVLSYNVSEGEPLVGEATFKYTDLEFIENV